MAFSEEVASLLVAAGVGTLNASIFIGSAAQIPPGDGPYLSIIETGGRRPMRTHNSVATPAYPQPAGQMVVRAKTTVAARAMLRQAYNAVAGVRNQTVSGRRYLEIDVAQEPVDLGPDATGRTRWSLNINAITAA